MKHKRISIVVIFGLITSLGLLSIENAKAEEGPKKTFNEAINLGLPENKLNELGKSFQFTTPDGLVFGKLGTDYFQQKQNQGLLLKSSLGDCITDNRGCWSVSKKQYVPLILNLTKLNLINKSNVALHSVNDHHIVVNQVLWGWVAAVAEVVAAVAGAVFVVATTVVSAPAVATAAAVIGAAATVVAAVSGVMACATSHSC